MNSNINVSISSDERLWRAVVAGDTAAFHSVVERYQGAISAIAFSVLGDFAASQDIAQETFWDAWKSRGQLRVPQRLGAWLCAIARNLAHDWRRHNRKLESNRMESLCKPISAVADATEQSISAEEQSIVWSSLQELPQNYREVLALYYRQGKTAAEVALELELSEDAVKQRLSRGRNLLREQVATLIEDVLVRSRPGKSFTAKVMAGIVGLTAAQTGGTALAASTAGKIAGGAASGVATLAFIVYVTTQTIRAQRMVRELRAHISSDDDPNLSPFKQKLQTVATSAGFARWKGRSYTSKWRFLTLPLVDVQVSDPFTMADGANRKPKIARGWIAVGDRAHGVLLGIGGFARGLVAIGGIAVGGFCVGGMSLGLASLGGVAVGLLSLGGLAIGHTALGGGALGWDAAGGAAVGWHSAAGGFAISNHAAMGGFAVARDFAVGGQAIAAQSNTPAAQQAIERETLKWTVDWLIANQALFIAAIVVISIAPTLMSLAFYRRERVVDNELSGQ